MLIKIAEFYHWRLKLTLTSLLSIAKALCHVILEKVLIASDRINYYFYFLHYQKKKLIRKFYAIRIKHRLTFLTPFVMVSVHNNASLHNRVPHSQQY